MANFKLGMNGKAYASATAITANDDTAVAAAITGGSEVSNLRDLSINLSTAQTDVTTRANGNWEASAATLKNGTITFTMQAKDSDTGLGIIETAWSNSDELFFAALDGPSGTEGNRGLVGNFVVTNFTRNENLTEAITYDVELRPSSFNKWYVVPAA